LLVKHSLTITASCPVDGKPDHYEAVIECSRVLKVEDILAAVETLKGQKIFQEQLTQELARAIGAKVTTTGYHSGVKTVCEC
jgi:NADPH-dependent 7-cyano-7-deazaguanine reductase QueF